MSKGKEKSVEKTKDEILESEDAETPASEENKPVEVVLKEEYDQLAQELQQSQTQAKDYFEGWQRERADFANYKRRIERDQQMQKQNITIDVIKNT